MRNLTVNNVRRILSAVINRVVDADKDPRFTAVRVEGFEKFHLDRNDIRRKLNSLRHELDDLERTLDNDAMLFGGSNITSKAADLDAALNDHVGKVRLLDELANMLSEKPELE